VLESAEHKAHALRMARESIVLLKNQNNTLPLAKNLKRIAVIGPNADNAIAVLGNYNGVPSSITTVLQGIKNSAGPNTEVVYERGVNFTNDTLLEYADVSRQYMMNGQQGFSAEYFNNRELKGEPVAKRQESAIDYNWQEGQIVIDTLKAYNFSARFASDFQATTSVEITFEVDADDGYRFLIDGKEVLNAWTRNRWGARTYKLIAEAGKSYHLVLEYYQSEGKAGVHLRAGHFAKSDFGKLTASVKDADAIVFVGGISPQLEGEEMRVDYPGFNGGDRTSIMLPAAQTEILKALEATGKPVVFVLMTGSAIAMPWEAEHLDAIVNAWYGGQSAGTAVAEVLFGDYNPSGRLPVTFYASDNDLPSFSDYSMSNRTYRYFKGQPLFAFGDGLSYTTFKYAGVRVQQSGTGSMRKLHVTATVTNTGKRAGDEVVQLYVSGANGSSTLRALKSFQRLTLQPGESKMVRFTLTAADIAENDATGLPKKLAGKITVSIGGRQPGALALQHNSVVQTQVAVAN
jgi:beta-glucosidase